MPATQHFEEPLNLHPERTPDAPNSPSQQSHRSRSRRLLALIVGLVGLLLIYFLANTSAHRSDPQPSGKGGTARVIQLNVLNGTGESKLAQRLTDFLRAHGFDVVEMGNYKSSSVEHTLVLDRIGNIGAAKSVAGALGVSEERVSQQLDKTLYLDVSVVIGKDYSTLKAFR